MPRASFSRAVLEACPPGLAVAEFPGITWSDLGSPRRVFEVLERARIHPPWLAVPDAAEPRADAWTREKGGTP